MSIKLMICFVTIVNNDFNITKASEVLCISQSALSKKITTFETYYAVKIFHRDKGRLTSLTPIGLVFYNKSVEIIDYYYRAIEEIENYATPKKKVIKIGIPTFILSDFCSEFIIKLSLGEYSNIKIEIVESNTADIRNKFENQQIDIAMVLAPTGFQPQNTDERLLYVTDLDLFLHKKHPLAKKTPGVTWHDLDSCNLVLPTPKSMLHAFIIDRLKSENVSCLNIYQIDQVDLIFQVVKTGNYITLLPAITKNRESDVLNKKIADPILWQVVLCKHKNVADNVSVNRLFNDISHYFSRHQESLGKSQPDKHDNSLISV